MLTEAIKSGIDIVDRLTEGIRVPSTCLVLGDPGTGKGIFCKQFIHTGLRSGQGAIYISCDERVDVIRRTFKEFGWHIDEYEQNGQLIMLDYSSSS